MSDAGEPEFEAVGVDQAAVEPAEAAPVPAETPSEVREPAELAKPIVPESKRDVPLTQKAVFDAERNRLVERRKAMNAVAFPDEPTNQRTDERTFGIALSGGGIRSATVSLGVLRSLGNAGLIPFIDYVSSVSGGSYIASFLCSRYVPSEWRGDVEVAPDARCFGGGGDPFAGADGEQGLNHLRQSGRHLLPGGAGDALRLVTIMVRSWVAIHLVIGVTLLTALLALKLPQIWWDDYWLDVEAGWASHLSPAFWPSVWMHGYPAAHWFVASWLLPAAAPFLLVGMAIFWSYFLSRGKPRPHDGRLWRALKGPGLQGALAVTVAGAALATIAPQRGGRAATAAAVSVAVFAAVSILAYLLAEWADFRDSRNQLAGRPEIEVAGAIASARVQEDRVRYRLTRWSSWWVRTALVIATLGVLDSVAQTLYLRDREFTYPLSAGAVLAVGVPLARQLITRLTQGSAATSALGKLLARFGQLVALVAGILLATIVGVFWAVLAHRLTWLGGPVGELATGLWFRGREISFYATLAAFAIGTGVISLSYSFLNLSTFANFYASNLRRAYLGASNVMRWRRPRPVQPNEDDVDDDVALERYFGEGVLAPLHLINVTINDTASRASNTTQRDRRGKPLTVSPSGYLYAGNGLRNELNVIPFGERDGLQAEKLPLSAWVGISGAAASTGMGQYGSLGLSLLAGLANLRLGYWWDPGPDRGHLGTGTVGLVQGRLLDELLGHFPGSDGDRWYLTDGGHFENTGAYELIRRRIALILVCDNGADPKYEFADLVTLTRRVRIDFDAELKFVDDPAVLDGYFGAGTPLRLAFGTLKDLGIAKGEQDSIGPYAALGEVVYNNPSNPAGVSDRTRSTVIWLKPRVCGAEALDLVAYARTHPPFPQESTLDQSYAEPQWESYYRLGLIMADRLFSANPTGTWRPRGLKPLA